MTTGISEAILEQLSDLVADKMGLSFPRERWHDLELKIDRVARESGFNDSELYIHEILFSSLSRRQIELLASHLTIGETYFFRDDGAFAALENRILPELIKYRIAYNKRLRIWSAGCCTGEEPYSIAMLLKKLLPDLPEWNITIIATDINTGFLRKGMQGKYTEWSFRNAPPWIKEKCFSHKKNRYYELNPDIKKMVNFSYLNLAEDTYPSIWNSTNAMDIIFCRNVLMYFTPERVQETIKKLYMSLLDGGWLIVSPAETSHTLFSQFTTINYSGATIYKKEIYRKDEIQQPTLITNEYKPDLAESIDSLAQPVNILAGTLPEVTFPSVSFLPDSSLTELVEENLDICESGPSPYDEAQTLYHKGLYIEAAEKLMSLASIDNDVETMKLLTRIYANLGRFDEALSWCDRAININKLDPGLYYLRAIILQEQGLLDDVAALLKRALYLDQEFVLAHFALGNLARGKGKLKEGNRHFVNALSSSEKYSHDEILPESDGISAGRLTEIMQSIIDTEKQHGR